MKRLFLFVIIVVILIGLFIKNIPFYAPANQQKGLTILKHKDDTIRLAYIGDSWAEGHKNAMCIIDSIINISTGKPVVVRTAGICGLTSKNVYYGIFRNDSMRSVIEWGPDFCFVVAGINDSDRKMGKKYYKENMRLIIDFLLEKHIIPIVLEIPSYDILFSYQRRSRLIKLQYLVSMLLTWSRMDCIDDYRKEYIELLDEQGWNNKVLTVYSKDWNPDGYKDKRNLYDGGLMHLNAKGYLVLDSCIAYKIIDHLSVSLENENH